MFRIKICGLTSPDEALEAARDGADAIGLNFYPLSPRCVDERLAEEISHALPPYIARVGVFVNSTVAEIRTIAARVPLDYVQIHGDEPPEFLAELAGLAVIRALRWQNDGEAVFDYLARARAAGCVPSAVLIDAHHPAQYGGTGETADWQAIAAARDRFEGLPLIVAGGLNPGNVAQALAIVRPAAVDTASGVELAPGRKSPALVRQFVQAALAEFSSLARE